jgi:hypothetical protein
VKKVAISPKSVEILDKTTYFYTESGAFLKTPFFDGSGEVESGTWFF